MLKRLFLSLALLLVFAAPGQAAEKVQRVVSEGGIEAWLIEDHLNPIISMKIEFEGGAAMDPDGKGGLANMVSATMDEGAGDLDTQAFRQELEDNAISLSFSAGRDSFSGSLKTLTENKDRAFTLLRLALTEPRFDEEPVERIRQQLLAGLRRDLENPNALAGRKIMETFFGDHPYARATKGTAESVTAITTEDIRTFVKERIAKDNLVIGVVGDITPDVLKTVLDETFGGLPETSKPADIADITPSLPGGEVVIEKAIPQSQILFGHAGIKRDDPDFFTAYVMNHILGGGGFTSRLYREVREERGLAYSVYSYLHPMDHAALFMGGAGTANERVHETISVVRDNWKRLAEDGATKDEIKDAKTFLTGSFPLRFTSIDRLASTLVGMQTESLGIDYLDRRNSYIEAVTRKEVKRVAKELLDEKALTMVIVGQPTETKATN